MRNESLDDLLIQADAAYEGVVGDPRTFGEVAAAVVGEARRQGAVEALVVGLRALAWFERSRLANVRAKQLLDEAAGLARRAHLDGRLGEVLVTRSAVNHELGRTGAAVRDLDAALALANGEVSPDLELKRGALLHNLGRLVEAAGAYRRILDHPASPTDVRTRAANNLGLIESLRGRAGEAFRYIELAVELSHAVGPAFVAVVAHNRGLILAQNGRLAESIRQLDSATQLLVEADIPLGEFYADHAEVLADLRLLPEARELAQRAAEQLEKHDVLLMAAEARLRVAQIALLGGDHIAAVESAELAGIQFRDHRRAAWVAYAAVVVAQAGHAGGQASRADLERARRAAGVLRRRGIWSGAVDASITAGRVAAALGKPVVARRWFGAAVEASARGPLLLRLKGKLAGALAARTAGDDVAVLAYCRAGLADLARHRAVLASAELRALASGHGAELGQIGLEVVLRRGAGAQALDWMERTRAAALLAVDPPAPDDVRDERAALAATYTEIAEARRGTGAEPVALFARQAALEQRIRRATWQRAGSGATPGSVVPFREVRGLLGDRVLIAYGRRGSDLFAMVADARRSRFVQLGPAATVHFERDALIFALRRLTRPGSAAALAAARTSADHAVDRLAAVLLEPLGIAADRPLVVVPTGELNRVPWSALHPAPVSVAPSASSWARSWTRRPATGGGRTVVVAGPDLPGAEREAAAVAELYAEPVVLTGGSATMPAVIEALSSADLAHLACHGLLRADNPTFSALQLADGRLTVQELDLHGIAPARIVLAACDSAADVAYPGDELLGLVSALIGRGTAGVVAGVVAVGDVEAVGLMTELHRRARDGTPLADALHAARRCLDRTDPRQFVNWCAFTAYGAG